MVSLNHEHIMSFVPDHNYGVDLKTLRKQLFKMKEDEDNTCLAILARGEVLAIAGATYLTDFSMEFWSMPSVLIQKMKHQYCKTIKRACYTLMNNVSAHRFVIAIEEDRSEWLKWASWMGFEFEAFAKGYCHDGKSAWLFTKVYPKWQQEQ